MMNMFFSSLIIFVIANIMMMLCIFLSKKSFMEREKISPFECGFDQKASSRLPFSLHFFLIAIIFLIFDVEIALLLPAISSFYLSSSTSWLVTNLLFIIIILVGIIHEWNQNMLNWSN